MNTISDLKKNEVQISIFSILGFLFWSFILIVLFLQIVVFQKVTIVGRSMEENYFDGQTLLVNRIDTSHQRGQVVAVYKDREVARDANYFTPYTGAVFYLKRIIALPGECIEMYEDKVIIYDNNCTNGKILIEDYISSNLSQILRNQSYYFPKTKVPQNHYFLMGDNRINSADSRILGSFPDYSLFGEESVRIWPFSESRFFTLPKYSYQEIDVRLKSNLERMNSGNISQ
jgi:signal peptidase I